MVGFPRFGLIKNTTAVNALQVPMLVQCLSFSGGSPPGAMTDLQGMQFNLSGLSSRSNFQLPHVMSAHSGNIWHSGPLGVCWLLVAEALAQWPLGVCWLLVAGVQCCSYLCTGHLRPWMASRAKPWASLVLCVFKSLPRLLTVLSTCE